MSFLKYPDYKDSGVEWLGEVPGHWEVQLVKNLASIVNGYPFDSTLFDAAEGSPLIRIRDLNKSEAETFYKGDFIETAAITSDDVLIGMDGDFNVGRWRGVGRALLNQRMCCIRGKSKVLTRLLEYTLPIRLKAINDVTYATTVKHLASSQVEKILVAMPSNASEQTQIAAFLDCETTKIDALVAEQRRLMALLKEKRQAVISHAVTRGLNPHAPMKPSGIEWLGDVPEHWEVKQLRKFAEILRGKFTHRPRNDPAFYDGEYPFIQTGDITGTDRYITEFKQTLNERGVSVSKQFPKGSLVMAIAANIGDVAILTFPAYFPDSIVGLVPNVGVDLNFLFYMMMTLKQPLERNATVSTQMNLNVEQISSVVSVCPPLMEQRKIAAHLESELAKFDTLTTEAQRAINLLQERRTALISAAVTGQIDVRDAAIA